MKTIILKDNSAEYMRLTNLIDEERAAELVTGQQVIFFKNSVYITY